MSLAALLAEERALLRAGAHDRLGDLARRKAALAGTLTPDEARALAPELARNAGLLRAAMEGMRAAMAQTRARTQARAGFATYGPDGRRAGIDSNPRDPGARR
ncbi:hypothetical protein [Limimaricola pyoseonensis]|uniref:FlgN protein n=1 Tax=Limimaricola pyoseonensis TaxID=521013 RepID=A0A1G7EPA0_9RHOB|nr:hypothetical protein [Limimaricola pyoseonensis]SDE65508.1 hypothetical protein SAMN04488567_2245 [Limimaricola pyoseonensis]